MNVNPKNAEYTQFELSKLLISTKFFSKNKMSPSARLVLVVLCSHYPNMYPSIKTIQEESGIASKTSVINSLKELSKMGIVFYETKNVNHYAFTGVFFGQLNIEPQGCKNWDKGGPKIGNKQINKKINNKSFLKFKDEKGESKDISENNQSRKRKYFHNTHITGMSYPKYKRVEQKKESPIDMTKEQAIKFLKTLPKQLKNSYYARELQKKWNYFI